MRVLSHEPFRVFHNTRILPETGGFGGIVLAIDRTRVVPARPIRFNLLAPRVHIDTLARSAVFFVYDPIETRLLNAVRAKVRVMGTAAEPRYRDFAHGWAWYQPIRRLVRGFGVGAKGVTSYEPAIRPERRDRRA